MFFLSIANYFEKLEDVLKNNNFSLDNLVEDAINNNDIEISLCVFKFYQSRIDYYKSLLEEKAKDSTSLNPLQPTTKSQPSMASNLSLGNSLFTSFQSSQVKPPARAPLIKVVLVN